MSDARPSEAFSGLATGVALVAGLVELFYKPFLFAPIGVLLLLAGTIASGRYRRLTATAAFVIAICFVIGAAIAVWDSRALY